MVGGRRFGMGFIRIGNPIRPPDKQARRPNESGAAINTPVDKIVTDHQRKSLGRRIDQILKARRVSSDLERKINGIILQFMKSPAESTTERRELLVLPDRCKLQKKVDVIKQPLADREHPIAEGLLSDSRVTQFGDVAGLELLKAQTDFKT